MAGSGEADRGSDSGSGDEAMLISQVSCSICLETVKNGGDRSTAKLQCGHRFHLDCIGSAFNVKGMMQCPNCRKIEKGNWLYANGRSYPEAGIDDWGYDEDIYDLNYAEMPFGIHWCPYSRVAHLHSSFEEGESTSISYQDLVAHPPFFPDHPAPSSVHSCPYAAYFPLQPSSQPTADSRGADDAAISYHQWGGMLGRSDLPSSRNFQNPEFYPPPYSGPGGGRSVGTESMAGASTALRPTRLGSDRHPRPAPFMSPFLVGHGSPATGAATGAPSISVGPTYHGSSRGQASYHQRGNSGLPPMNLPPPPPPPMPPTSGNSRFYVFSGGPGLPEVENFGGGRLYAWERDRFSPFPLVQVERAASWWGPVQWHGPESRPGQGRSSGGAHRAAQPS
ncbi:RING/U-box superfamily protein [Wolffia australiana]